MASFFINEEGNHNEEVIQRRMREGMTVGSPSPHQQFVRKSQTDAAPSEQSPTGLCQSDNTFTVGRSRSRYLILSSLRLSKSFHSMYV